MVVAEILRTTENGDENMGKQNRNADMDVHKDTGEVSDVAWVPSPKFSQLLPSIRVKHHQGP